MAPKFPNRELFLFTLNKRSERKGRGGVDLYIR
jgi:hypothetical protein